MKTYNIRVFVGLLLVFCFAGILYGQEVKINDNFAIEADGTVRLDNDATVWDDLNVFPDAVSRRVSEPDYIEFQNDGSSSMGVYLNMFASTIEEEVFFTIQIPHSYKVGTNLHPHIHWTTNTGTPDRDNVVWGLEYTITSIGGVYGNTTIVVADSIIPSITPTSAKQHFVSSFPEIDGTGIGISAIISCRLFRAVDNALDDFGNDAGFLGLDFHYEQDTQGSRLPFVK